MVWYQESIENVISQLSVDTHNGLASQEVKKRQERYGLNELPRGKKKTWWQFLFAQFKSPLVYILVVAALLTAWLGEYVDTSVILLAVLVNIAVGFWQEFRSNNILEHLQKIVKVSAYVVRDGETHEVEAATLVPGDIILLKSGIKVPADARLVTSSDLEINEALLTGESNPVKKEPSTLDKKDLPVGDRKNMVHMGTVIEKGEGRAVVVATGPDTEIGMIALLTQAAEEEPTPLQHRIGNLGKKISILVGIAAVLIFLVGFFEATYSVREMFTTAIAVAVAAIPEGLPAAISIVLAVSAQRILSQKGITKTLLAAETLGSASVICTDKTGTLTEGKMKVEWLINYGSEELSYRCLALANEALVERIEKGYLVKGETTDRAKMQAFIDHGGNFKNLLAKLPRIKLIPFDSDIRYIASIHKGDERGEYFMYLTGEPETLLRLSARVYDKDSVVSLGEVRRKAISKEFEEAALKGYRMIALAQKSVKDIEDGEFFHTASDKEREKFISELTFAGFAAIRDPVREDVKVSIQSAREAGIKPVMLTGDHKFTAYAVGKELGFVTSEEGVVEGKDLENISEDELAEKIDAINVFARVNPRHKMQIIHAWQKKHAVVAMTGDGVNDAPALKSADIGVALGSGTDVAKEASDLILLDDSFSVIVSAIRMGRVAFDNIKKVTVFLLSGSFTELVLIASSLIFRLPLPVTAVQILWTNLVEDSLPNVALSFEPGEEDVMRRKPVKKNEPILDSESKTIIFAVGLTTDFLLFGLFLFLYFYSPYELDHIRTIIFAKLGIDTFFYIYSIKSLKLPIYKYNIFNNPYLIGATVIGVGLMVSAVHVPFLNRLLDTVPLSFEDWGVVAGLATLNLVGIEIVKWVFRWKNKVALA